MTNVATILHKSANTYMKIVDPSKLIGSNNFGHTAYLLEMTMYKNNKYQIRHNASKYANIY